MSLGCWWPGGNAARIGDVQTCKDCGRESRTRVRAGWKYSDGSTGPVTAPAGRKCLSFDMDGVLHRGAGYSAKYGEVDTAGIAMAHERGLAVCVMTCSVLSQVAAALRASGLAVEVDHKCQRATWAGGPGSGRTVLVTARKIDCIGFVDDRAVNYQAGQPWGPVFDQLDALADRRHGFKSCVPGEHHHWGADGAAGLLPVATGPDGETCVLLGKRGSQTQSGGTWSTFGGAIENGETPLDAAQREAREEIDGLGALELAGEHVSDCPHGCGWSYATFTVRAELAGPVRVRDKWETQGLLWARLDDVPAMDLHPGLRASWPALDAAIRSGAIDS
jgi:8-oxo-dGTP pyrophosphatase MutT (NUDIX family)